MRLTTKFLDFTSLLDGDPASIAILSTFQLDPDFFERRILRCPSLAKARRIIVLMDAGQWLSLIRNDVTARLLNRRYLVVPIRPSRGVFHAKLSLLVTETSGLVLCGSNNLTRSGCSNNLELLNAIRIDPVTDNMEATLLAQQSFEFFRRACDYAEVEAGNIAREWLDESLANTAWLSAAVPPVSNYKVRLIHTYDGTLWDRLTSLLDKSPPKRVLVISPFHDLDCELSKRVFNRWPKCKMEFIVQQNITTLPISSLKPFRSRVHLSEIRTQSRRLHAKLVAWDNNQGMGCLVGSANFTTAAFDSLNTEACILISEADRFVNSLFDGQLSKKAISFSDFEPGKDREPTPEENEGTPLVIVSALLNEVGQLKVAYKHRLMPSPAYLQLAIRTPDEPRPRAMLELPVRENWTATLIPPEVVFKDVHGTLLASLVADVEGIRQESPPIWVIQKQRLTHDPADNSRSSRRLNVDETGEGLNEILEEIGRRDGPVAIIEYLRHLTIRFNDGSGRLPGQRKFRLRIRDPFRPDVAPDWLIHAKSETTTLAQAIYEFVDRHEVRRLRRHLKRGNINGMENFLDILTALIRLLYIYCRRGVVHRNQLIGRICDYIEIAMSGTDEDGNAVPGYLCNVFDNLGSNSSYLQEVIDELNFFGQIQAALLIVQSVRFVPGEKLRGIPPATRPSECLPYLVTQIKKTVNDLRLVAPPTEKVMKALAEYNMFSEAELNSLAQEV